MKLKPKDLLSLTKRICCKPGIVSTFRCSFCLFIHCALKLEKTYEVSFALAKHMSKQVSLLSDQPNSISARYSLVLRTIDSTERLGPQRISSSLYVTCRWPMQRRSWMVGRQWRRRRADMREHLIP